MRPNLPRYRLALASAIAAALAGCSPSSIPQPRGDRSIEPDAPEVEWNQAFIAARLGLAPPEPPPLGPPCPPPDFNDPASVLRFVLAHAPHAPVVYPSERYYYFKFPLGPRIVSGNIRFADADLGVVSVGYFDAENPRDLRTAEFRQGDGRTRVALDAESFTVDLFFDGYQRCFTLDRSAFEASSFRPLHGEVMISGILDESGYYLHLVYWKPGRCFYYVLNADKPRPEPWTPEHAGSHTLLFGRDSRFCFYAHRPSGRLILVGVSRRQIELNSWFDGPFDQVPPRLDIRLILEEAYPYVLDAGGIDPHGAFLARPGHRVAISPYIEYDSGSQLRAMIAPIVSDAHDPSAWTRATYEYKRDWRSSEPAVSAPPHTLAVSSAWPANHWGWSSAAWGPEHLASTSIRWPPSHDPALSRSHQPPPIRPR